MESMTPRLPVNREALKTNIIVGLVALVIGTMIGSNNPPAPAEASTPTPTTVVVPKAP